ncbi:MAG: HEAT repeat domain-containing protein [Candidatus Acidiferrales bacterium]
MSPSDKSDSTVAVRQVIAACLREHQAMQCYVRQEELFVLPISLSDDKVVVVPIDTGDWEVARRKTLKLASIEEPRLHKMQVRAEDLERVRLATKHSYPTQITYFDESGKEVEAEVDSALREEGDFLVGDRVHIRIQWISQVSFSLPDYKNEIQRRKLPALVDELVKSPYYVFRQSGLFLAQGLPREEHFCVLQELSTDSDSNVRASAADCTRGFTARIRKTVQGKRYTCLGGTQDPRIFGILRTLAADESPNVRLKAAHALGDHLYEEAGKLLDDLLRDSSEEVRKAAEHAKARIDSQRALADEFETAINQSRTQDLVTPPTNDGT